MQIGVFCGATMWPFYMILYGNAFLICCVRNVVRMSFPNVRLIKNATKRTTILETRRRVFCCCYYRNKYYQRQHRTPRQKEITENTEGFCGATHSCYTFRAQKRSFVSPLSPRKNSHCGLTREAKKIVYILSPPSFL